MCKKSGSKETRCAFQTSKKKNIFNRFLYETDTNNNSEKGKQYIQRDNENVAPLSKLHLVRQIKISTDKDKDKVTKNSRA